MGALLSMLAKLLSGEENAKICIVGLAGAGKTSILHRMGHGTAVETIPTIGSNVEMLVRGRLKIEAWDLGGQESLRSSWTAYFLNTDGLVLVVDSTDAATLPIVLTELGKLLVNGDLVDVPLLILANKQDLPGAASAIDISAGLHLDEIKTRPYYFQACSAKTGAGVEEGLTWLAGCMKRH